MSDPRAFSDLVSPLVRLRQSLDDVTLPLATDGVEQARGARAALVDQLDEYVLPRLLQIDAPLLAVVGGSTGAGKSTLVNALAGAAVSPSGVLRPTTRAPVLVHHPDDGGWFQGDRILPDLPRSGTATAAADGDSLQVVACSGIPRGLALVDAPDVDSVDRANRELAAGLLAAADLWIFVTSAARYADQVPWEVLADAVRRSTAVAIVLDRTAPEHIAEVRNYLARMLTRRGLKGSPLFDVPESTLVDGLLPPETVALVRAWLVELAADTAARGVLVERSLLGTVRTLVQTAHQVADAASAQIDATDRLRVAVDSVYTAATDAVVSEVESGALLRGLALTRWQQLLAAGDPDRWAEGRAAGVLDRLSAVVRNRAHPGTRPEEAVTATVSAALVDAAGRALLGTADRRRLGAPLASGDDELARARATRALRARATATASQWQAGAHNAVRTALAAQDPGAERLVGVAVILQVAALGGGHVGAEAGREHPAAASPNDEAASQARQLLRRAVDGDPTAMVERVAADLSARTRALLAAEHHAGLATVADVSTGADEVEQLRRATRAVDDRRPSDLVRDRV